MMQLRCIIKKLLLYWVTKL